jgi:hypothetical protein
LTLQNINDTESNFSVKVIGTCGTLPAQIPSKANFNSAFKQSLTTYKDSDDCPTTAKQ